MIPEYSLGIKQVLLYSSKKCDPTENRGQVSKLASSLNKVFAPLSSAFVPR